LTGGVFRFVVQLGMPKAKGISLRGMKFEDALKRMLNTPLPNSKKPALEGRKPKKNCG
jgi:hypothetical protein